MELFTCSIRCVCTIAFPFISQFAAAQSVEYTDYIGAGHVQGIGVVTSSDVAKPKESKNASGLNTLNGSGMDSDAMEAARFLRQAGFGGSEAEIDALKGNLNFEKWIDAQMGTSFGLMTSSVRNIYVQSKNSHYVRGNDVTNYGNTERHFQYTWWHRMMTDPSVLRNRMALALSEILVISNDSDIPNDGMVFASYYDVLLRNTFGNYRTLLDEVTYHPAMGQYLSHLKNPKTDTVKNTFPDENYAREVMQLFTIGLYELNLDGSQKLDDAGQSIPTYQIDDVKELAKVFTGLGAGALSEAGIKKGKELNFWTGKGDMDFTVPMAMYDNKHEPGEKTLINGFQLPSSNNGKDDVRMALDHLFYQPSAAPFICRKLIQHFIKSNPSAIYIEDVSKVFNDNGYGLRGDLAAVLKAILLHEEARSCIWQEEPTHGKLVAPVLRFSNIARVMQKDAPNGLYLSNGYSLQNNTAQRVMDSPSVFNFYSPDFQPNWTARRSRSLCS